MDLCEDIQKRINEQNAKLSELTGKMDELIIMGQVDFKAATKSTNKEVIELSRKIEQAAKNVQKVYDNKDFMKFCVILHE